MVPGDAQGSVCPGGYAHLLDVEVGAKDLEDAPSEVAVGQVAEDHQPSLHQPLTRECDRGHDHRRQREGGRKLSGALHRLDTRAAVGVNYDSNHEYVMHGLDERGAVWLQYDLHRNEHVIAVCTMHGLDGADAETNVVHGEGDAGADRNGGEQLHLVSARK